MPNPGTPRGNEGHRIRDKGDGEEAIEEQEGHWFQVRGEHRFFVGLAPSSL